MTKIRLKDFSKKSIVNNKLYKNLNGATLITLDTSICEVVADNKDSTEPILDIRKGEEENYVEITTFGYVGRFTYAKVEFDISYRFGDVLLDRMITKVNDFDVKSLDSESKPSNKKSSNDSLAMKILYMNFIFRLEKLSMLGIPKSYERIEHHDSKLKGQIDINRFIKKDMPYQGKISSVSYEQCYVQDILDVLYGALKVVEGSMQKLVDDRLFQIKNLIYNHADRRFVNERTIENAIYHKSIQNSLYAEFKQLLEISGYIIRNNNKQEYKANATFRGLIFDVSLLWESYLYELLKEKFEVDDWKVIHEDECDVYHNMFFARGLKPDIVIKNKNLKKIIVLDAKSKSMKFQRGGGDGAWGDLDRSDFFQINTYMTYYNQQGYEVLAGGLLYPIEAEFDCRFNDEIECIEDYRNRKAHSESWFGSSNTNTKFIVDGIDLFAIDDDSKILDIKNREDAFIERIKQLSGDIQT